MPRERHVDLGGEIENFWPEPDRNREQSRWRLKVRERSIFIREKGR
jgi:hypothetical protein